MSTKLQVSHLVKTQRIIVRSCWCTISLDQFFAILTSMPSTTSTEIERKFLVPTPPDLTGKSPIVYERYYIYSQHGIELRVQKKGEIFEIERKEMVSDLSRSTEKLEISQDEFEILKTLAHKSIIRKSYVLSKNPETSLKIYEGDYVGLIRCEVEFASEDEANKFEVPGWCGAEITTSILGKDSKLVNLSRDEFLQEINTASRTSIVVNAS